MSETPTWDSKLLPLAGLPVNEAERVSLHTHAAAIDRLTELVAQALARPDLPTAAGPAIEAEVFSSFTDELGLANAPVSGPAQTAIAQVEAALGCFRRLDGKLHVTTEILQDAAMEAARKLDSNAETKTLPLHGLPIIIKDVFDVEGRVTRANCKALEDRPAAHDAAIVTRLRKVGGVPIAKGVCWELSFAETRDATAMHRRATNPWSPMRDTGGSSSGVAAAVAAGCCPAGLGSDTGGSSRGPAAWCGIVGFKPTSGIFSLQGCKPLSPSFDCPGFMTPDVDLCKRMFASLTEDLRPNQACPSSPRIRLGLWRSAYREAAPAKPEVARLVENAMAKLVRLGVEVVEVRLPPLDLYSAIFVILARQETFKTWRHLLLEERSLLGTTLRERLLACGLFSNALVAQARTLLARLRTETDELLMEIDAVVLPTMPTAAPPTTKAAAPMAFDRPAYVRFASLLGLPSLSLPCGLTTEGMPVGVMLNGRRGEDRRLLEIAALVERICPPLAPPSVLGEER